MAKMVANNAPIAVSMMKQAMKHSRTSNSESCLELMSAFQGIVQRTDDHFEGVDAILNKREPTFLGR